MTLLEQCQIWNEKDEYQKIIDTIEAGVPAELIRISLGLEDKEDLIADISNALDAIK